MITQFLSDFARVVSGPLAPVAIPSALFVGAVLVVMLSALVGRWWNR